MHYKEIVLFIMTALFLVLWITLFFTKSQNRAVSKVFNIFVINMAIWAFGLGMFYRSADLGTALFWAKILYLAGSLIPTAFLLLSYIFPTGEFKIGKLRRFLIFTPNIVLFILFFFTPIIVKEVKIINGIKGVIYGPGHILWDIQFDTIFAWGFIRFIRMYKHYAGIIKEKLRYIILGTLIGVILAGVTNVIMPWFNRFELLWLGPLLTLTWLIAITYAIVKYQLMEVKIAVARTSIFILVYTSVLGLPFLFGAKTGLWIAAVGIMGVLATTGPFIYSYLRKRTEAILLAEQLRYQREMKEFSSTLIQIKDLKELTEKVVSELMFSMNLTFAAIYLKNNGQFCLKSMKTKDSEKLPEQIDGESKFIKRLKKTTAPLAGEYLSEWESADVGVASVLIFNSDLSGFIILGQKEKGGIFTEADIDMLSILTSQTSLALSEIYYFNEYQRATNEKHKIELEKERLESAFQISEAYRHELGNIINIITLASASLMGGRDYEVTKEDIKESGAAIYNNTQRANNIFNAIKNYNEKAKEGFSEIDISGVVREQINNHQEIIKEKNISIGTKVETGIKISANKNLAYAVKYLIEGAIRAIEYYKPKDGVITVNLRKDKEKAVLEITDTGGDVLGDNIYKGVGIERGKEGGITYFIARRIIFDHRGKFKIISFNEGVGTRFIITIPLKKGEE